MSWYYILLIVIGSVLLAAIILILSVSYLIARFSIAKPARYKREEQKVYNHQMGFDLGTETMTRTPIEFKMNDGYVLHGDYSLVKGSKKFCLLCHGHRSSREGALRYSVLFRELGYSTIIYDQRSHGDNIHKTVTMGYQESKDLSAVIDEVYEKFGKDIYLGLQGVSMGAATVLLSTKYQQKVKFIVSDCSYSYLKDVIRDMIRRYHLPSKILLPFINFYLKTLYHFSFDDASPINCIASNKIPVLFIHGQDDLFINVKAVEELYEKATSKKELVIFKNAGHASSLTVNRELYKKSLTEFLSSID